MEELQRVIPNSEIRVRKGLDLKKIIPQAKEKGFTALIVVNEDRKVPSILSIFFRVFNNKHNQPSTTLIPWFVQVMENLESHGI